MVVALYSGSLTQFFLGAWIEDVPDDDTDADAASDDEDDDDPETVHDPDEVRTVFEQVRLNLTAQVKPFAAAAPAWVEAADGPRVVAVLETEEYGALMLLAARVAARGQPMPPYNKKRAWSDDPAVRALVLAERDVGTMHHLVKADTWLPADFAPILAARLPYANVHIGSTTQLAAALATLKDAFDGPLPLPPDTVAAARRAFQAFQTILAHAQRESLPMVVDV